MHTSAAIAHDRWIGEGLHLYLPAASGLCLVARSRRVPPATRFDSWHPMVQPPGMASSLVQRNKVVAKRKGVMAAAAAAGVGVCAVAGAPVIAAVGLFGAAYLTYDWFSFRVKNGMRF